MKIPENVRKRAIANGDESLAWLDTAPQTAAELAAAWQLTLDDPLDGGSESLVLPATRLDGTQAILKIGMLPTCDVSAEASFLELVDGKGYAKLYEHSVTHNAMLIERLGAMLADSGLSADQQITTICETLNTAWIPLADPTGFTTGGQKAIWLAEFIEKMWRDLGQPCERATKQRALEFCEERESAHASAERVLVHGDAHEQNTLQVIGAAGQYKFVDPDGMYAEKACDLAVPMRGFNQGVLAGNVALIGRWRCAMIAELTNTEPRAVWQWGLMERVSTGLVLVHLDIKDEGMEMLRIADLWAQEPCPS